MKYYKRNITYKTLNYLEYFPAVAIICPRQCGKTTLAKHIINNKPGSIYLDLENPDDLVKLEEPTLFFKQYSSGLICIDEVQRKPEIFTILRSIIDNNKRNGQFLILGSASPDLLKQSSETLAGRIIYQELSPFLLSELDLNLTDKLFKDYWVKGGFPRSYLSDNEISYEWRKAFIKTFLERDLSNFGFYYPPETMHRLWQMLSHSQGQLVNLSSLSKSLGMSHTMVRNYLDAFQQTFMVRILQPWSGNLKKRLIKSPKVYIRDTGILHTLLNIRNFNSLFGNSIAGVSWETMIIENIIQNCQGFEYSFYRTSNGNELDLVLHKDSKTYAIEIKLSTAPKLSSGFYTSLNDLNVEKAWVVSPVDEAFPIKNNVVVGSLDYVIGELGKI